MTAHISSGWPAIRQRLHGPLFLFQLLVLCVAFLALCVASDTKAMGSAQTPPQPIVLLPRQVYKQNFDSLAAHGTDHSFPPDGMGTGWWTSRPTYSASSGSPSPGVGGGLFSYGQEESGERALGSITSNQVHHTAWGVVFRVDEHETSDSSLWALEVAYTGEQWSAGGNASSVLIFDYSIASLADYENGQMWGIYDKTPGLWMVKDRLSFTSPVVGGEERGLNGNDPANRRALKHTLAIDDWGTDKVVQLRWTHRDREGKDHALATDDLSVTLVELREVKASRSTHHRTRTWLYAGISVVGVVLSLIIAGLVITLIVKRKRNERAAEQSYALLRQDEEGGPGLGVGNTSINPVDVAVVMPSQYAMAMPPRPGFPPVGSSAPTFGAPSDEEETGPRDGGGDDAGHCDGRLPTTRCRTKNCESCGSVTGTELVDE